MNAKSCGFAGGAHGLASPLPDSSHGHAYCSRVLRTVSNSDAPYHAHVYYSPRERAAAEALHERFTRDAGILFVGRMMDRPVGPHPIAQFEAHFREGSVPNVRAMIEASGLRALVHPLTDDDLADHTDHAQWIGEPLELDVSALDPPGVNQGVARFGRSDF